MSVRNSISLLFPEHIILKTVNDLLTTIRTDFKNKQNEGRIEESLLYLLLNDQEVSDRSLYDEAVKIFITTPQNPKHFNCTLSFDHNDTKIPQLYVTQPAENPMNNSIGIGEGDQEEITFGRNAPEQDEYRVQFMRRYNATHYILIVCENRIEMTVIYNVLKAFLVSCINHFELEGLSNLQIAGQELKMRNEIPDRLFQKAIVMTFQYEQVSPSLVIEDVFRKIRIFWKPEGAETPQGPIEFEESDDLNDDSSI